MVHRKGAGIRTFNGNVTRSVTGLMPGDCRFLVDRALAQTVFSTLPEKKAGRYQRRLSSLFR